MTRLTQYVCAYFFDPSAMARRTRKNSTKSPWSFQFCPPGRTTLKGGHVGLILVFDFLTTPSYVQKPPFLDRLVEVFGD